METLLGIKGKDFAMLAADKTQFNSIFVLKDDDTKITKINNNLMIATCGGSGDTVQFAEFISKNIALYRMRNGYELKPKAAAHYTRKNLADALRTRNSYNVNLLVAGYDKDEGSELHFIDYLANAKSVKYGTHGYGGMFASSIFDRYHHENITEDDAYDILTKCVYEIQKRLAINLPNFQVSVVNKDGVRNLSPITIKSINTDSEMITG